MFHHVRARSKNDDEDERPLNYGYKSTMAVLLPFIRPGIYTTICGNTLQEIHFKMSKNTVANRNHTDVFFGATSINTLQGFIKYTSFITKNLSSLIQIHTGGAM
jgi:hypothetical protein